MAQQKGVSKNAPQKQKPAAKKEENFIKTPSGLQYIIYESRNGKKPHEGDLLNIHYTIRNQKDSILEDSRDPKGISKGKTVPVPFTHKRKTVPGMMEVLGQMGEGDSAAFKILSDSLYKRAQRPGYIKSGEFLKFSFRIISVMNQDEIRAQMEVDHAEAMKKTEASRMAQGKKDEVVLQEYFKANDLKPSKTASGLYYTIDEPGKGDLIKNGDTVLVFYAGKLTDGKFFDANMEQVIKDNNMLRPGPYPPFKVVIGQHRVIQGWEEGLTLFRKGGKGTLYIPSNMAYGTQGYSPTIPPEANLIFLINISDVKAHK